MTQLYKQYIDIKESLGKKISVGSRVLLQDLHLLEEYEYILVPPKEADADRNRISIECPVGKGILGHYEGEIVKIKVPAGISRYKILKVS